MSTKTDDQLMSEIAEGNLMSFEILFDRHSSPALGYATRLLTDRARAEDFLQEAWMKVIRLAPSYKGSGHFRAWFYTLLRNACLNELRRVRTLELNSDDLKDLVEASSEQNLEEREKIEFLKEDMEKLPLNQKTALLLWAVEDLSYEEISHHMEIGLPAVKSLIFRARQTLRKRRSP